VDVFLKHGVQFRTMHHFLLKIEKTRRKTTNSPEMASDCTFQGNRST